MDRRQFLISGATVVATVRSGASDASLPCVQITDLRVDYLSKPLGLENPRPRLSWRMESDARNARQTAYQIQVGTSEHALEAGHADLWDSGRVASRRSFDLEYKGTPLLSRQQCYWRVRVWNEHDQPLLSSNSSWEMGLLAPSDWSARWLAAENPVARADREAGLHWMWGEETEQATRLGFRLKFSLHKPAHETLLFVTANDWPMWTQITRVWMDGAPIVGLGVWDNDVDRTGVTESSAVRHELGALPAGSHVLAVQVEAAARPGTMEDLNLDHFHLTHAIAGLLRLNLVDGEVLRIATGEGWKTAQVIDEEWVGSTFDDSAWAAARPVALDSQPWPPEPATWLRHEFTLSAVPVRARLYATALGAYECRLNGQRVGDALLTPEPSCYSQHILYQVYDVAGLLRAGANALGIIVGDGWYASFDDRYAWGPPPRRARAQLELLYPDGTREVIATGPEWLAHDSAILESQIRTGEIYDARLDQPGWDQAGFKATHWSRADLADPPPGHLTAQTSPPIRAVDAIQPVRLSEPKPGIFVADFGVNFSGWCKLHVEGSAGTRIELAYSELLESSGEIRHTYTNMGLPKKDIFILAGRGAQETFEPHFTHRGFRFVQISGVVAGPDSFKMVGVSIRTDLPISGAIRSSEPLIRDLWAATVRTHQTNFLALPLDTPSREARPYSEVAEISWDGAAYECDLAAFTRRVMDAFVDNQQVDGVFPRRILTPLYNNTMETTEGVTAGHGEAALVLPWTAWSRYGDTALIERYWAAMNRHLDFILANNPDYLWRNQRGHDEGDWYALDVTDADHTLPHTEKVVLATAFWAHALDLLADMGGAIGQVDDVERLRKTRQNVKAAFRTLIRPDGTVGNGSQTSQVLTLQFDLAPDELRPRVAERLVQSIRARGGALTTGIFGTQFVLDALVDNGFTELAYELILRTEYPSWGYMLRAGSSTIWETWSGHVKVPGSPDAVMGQNHPDLASASGFLFRHFAGIDAESPGFETILIRPKIDSRIKRGGGDYDSVMGRITTDWTQDSSGALRLNVTLPANTSALVFVPARDTDRVFEGRRRLSSRTVPRIVSRNTHEIIVEAGSGSYAFSVQDRRK